MNRRRDPELVALGKRIEAERNARGFSQVTLAEKAGCSPKLIRKLISGEKTRGKILSEVCTVLGIRADDRSPTEISDIEHGSYTLNNFAQYEGLYFAYRRSFVQPRNILRSLFEFEWDKKARLLLFREFQKYVSSETGEIVDRSQSGEIFVGSRNLLHLLTRDRGAVRLITLFPFRMQNPEDFKMSGIVLTQSPRQFQHIPSTAAITFEKVEGSKEALVRQVGEIRHGISNDHAKLAADLTRIERHVVAFALTPPPHDPLRPEQG